MPAVPVIGSMLLVNNPLCGGSLYPDVVALADDLGNTTSTFSVLGGVIGGRLSTRVAFDTEGWVASLNEQKPTLFLPNRNTPYRGIIQGSLSSLYITDYAPDTLQMFTRSFAKRPCGFSIALNGGGNSASVAIPSVSASASTQRYSIYGFNANRHMNTVSGPTYETVSSGLAGTPLIPGASNAPLVSPGVASGATIRIVVSGLTPQVPTISRLTFTSTIIDEDGTVVPSTTSVDITTCLGAGVTSYGYIFSMNLLSQGIPSCVVTNISATNQTVLINISYAKMSTAADKFCSGEEIAAEYARWDARCPLIFDAFGRVSHAVLPRDNNKQTLKCLRPDACHTNPSPNC